MFERARLSIGASRRTALVATAATIGTLALLLLSSVGADAAAMPAANPPQTWTSGHQVWNNTSATVHGYFGNVTTVGHFHLSTMNRVTATNTSNTTTQLQGWEWVNRSLSSSACAPNCTSPTFTYNWTYTSSELVVQFLNLTTQASVYENGNATPALGITNASSRATDSLAEMESASSAWGSFSYNETSSELAYNSVDFVTPLGLIPWNLTANATWQDRANYTAMGGWNDSITASSHWGNYSRNFSRSFNYTMNRTGAEGVTGHDFGSHVGTGNTTVIRIGLRFHGPYDFDNDLFMTAVRSDLFQGATANWTTQTRGGWGDDDGGQWEGGYQAAGDDVASVYASHTEAATVGGASGSGGSNGGTTGSGPQTGATGGTSTGSPTAGTSPNPGSQSPAPGQTTPRTGGDTPGSPTTSLPSSHGASHPSALGWPSWLSLAVLAGLVAVIGGAVALGLIRRRA